MDEKSNLIVSTGGVKKVGHPSTVVTIGVSKPPFSNSVAEIFLTGVVDPDPEQEPPVERGPEPELDTAVPGCC